MKNFSGRKFMVIASVSTLCVLMIMLVGGCVLQSNLFTVLKDLLLVLVVPFVNLVTKISDNYYGRTDRPTTEQTADKANNGGFITIKALIGLLVLSALMWVAIPTQAADVSLNNGQLVIENVWWQPFNGPLSLTVPWKNAKAAYYLDILHQPANSIVGAEGRIFAVPVSQAKAVNGNLMVASCVSGERNMGLCGLSLDISDTSINIVDNWQMGVFGASSFSGRDSLYGGLKAYTRFGGK